MIYRKYNADLEKIVQIKEPIMHVREKLCIFALKNWVSAPN